MAEKNKYAICTTSVARTAARRMKIKLGSKKSRQRSKWSKSEKKKYDSCLEKVDENLIRKMIIQLLYEASLEDYQKKRKELVKSKHKSAKYKSIADFPKYLIEQLEKGHKKFNFTWDDFTSRTSPFFKSITSDKLDKGIFYFVDKFALDLYYSDLPEKIERFYQYRLQEIIKKYIVHAVEGSKIGPYDFGETITVDKINTAFKLAYERSSQAAEIFLKRSPAINERLKLFRESHLQLRYGDDNDPEKENKLQNTLEQLARAIIPLFTDSDMIPLWADFRIMESIKELYYLFKDRVIADKVRAERRAEKYYYNTEQRKKLDKEWRVIHYIGAYVNRGTDSFTDAIQFIDQTSGKKSNKELAGVAYHIDNKYLGDNLASAEYGNMTRPPVGMLLKGVITSIFKEDVGSTKFRTQFGEESAGGYRSKSGEKLTQYTSGDEEKESGSFVRYPRDHNVLRKTKQSLGMEDDPKSLAQDLIMDLDQYAEKVKGKEFVYNEAFIDHWSTVGIIAKWDAIKKWTLANLEHVNPISITESLQKFWDAVTSKKLKFLKDNFQPWNKSEWDSYIEDFIEEVKPLYDKAKEDEKNKPAPMPKVIKKPRKKLEKPEENPSYTYSGDLTDNKEFNFKASQIAAILNTYGTENTSHFIKDEGFLDMDRLEKDYPAISSWVKYYNENPDKAKIPKLPDKFYLYYNPKLKKKVKIPGAAVYRGYDRDPFSKHYVKIDKRWVNVQEVPQIMKFGLSDEPLWTATLSNRKPLKVRPSDILQQLQNLEKGDEMKIFLEPPPGMPLNTGAWLEPDKHPVFKQHMRVLNEGKIRKRKKIKVLFERKKRRRNERN